LGYGENQRMVQVLETRLFELALRHYPYFLGDHVDVASVAKDGRWYFAKVSDLPLRQPWPSLGSQATMKRFSVMLPLLAVLATGCVYRTITAPGVKGRVIDSATGAPVHGARITRPLTTSFDGARVAPAITITSDRNGNFNLRPRFHICIHCYRFVEDEAAGDFQVTANGYATNNVHGRADKSTHWRVQAGEIFLKRQ
jgi:hypothetical protein